MSSPHSAGLSTSEKVQRAFSETVDPSVYVPRAATETVLAGLDSWTGENGPASTVGALIGRPGLGKTFLLKLFESRLAGRRDVEAGPVSALYLPYASLSITDLTLWIYGLLGRSMEGRPDVFEQADAAMAALLALGTSPEAPFLLLIDDADSMPLETVRALADGLPRENASLRILAALNDDAKASRMLAAFEALEPQVLTLGAPMDAAETAQYVDARMRWAALSPDEAARLTGAAGRKVHSLSGGLPRGVHQVAASVFEAGDAALPSELDEKERRENWMGQPIEDEL